MPKGPACFYCRHHTHARAHVGDGWSYDCKFGIDNSQMNGDVEDVLKCEKGSPQFGFQIGGYYTHMRFEPEDIGELEPNCCLEWIIMSDGSFPTNEDMQTQSIVFHVCDFRQIEEFVSFWGKRLRQKGIVKDDDKQDRSQRNE